MNRTGNGRGGSCVRICRRILHEKDVNHQWGLKVQYASFVIFVYFMQAHGHLNVEKRQSVEVFRFGFVVPDSWNSQFWNGRFRFKIFAEGKFLTSFKLLAHPDFVCNNENTKPLVHAHANQSK